MKCGTTYEKIAIQVDDDEWMINCEWPTTGLSYEKCLNWKLLNQVLSKFKISTSIIPHFHWSIDKMNCSLIRNKLSIWS